MGKRIRKRVSTTLDPALYSKAKEKGLQLSRLLDDAVKQALDSYARLEKLAESRDAIATKIGLSEKQIVRLCLEEDDDWTPDNPGKAMSVQAELCVSCEEAGMCTSPCDKFRSAYESR